MTDEAAAAPEVSPCRTCGACCAYSAEWPRFTVESDEEIDAIPPAHIAEDLSGMRCEDDRCSALAGEIGMFVTCTIHAVRPAVCRDCEPGDDACEMARALYGFEPISEESEGADEEE